MSGAQQWLEALEGRGEGFSLRFQRLGVEAECRTLDAGEVEECRRMGGERGLRYALYLACPQLREAGERMKEQGRLAVPFDITERLPYADVIAAGAAVLRQSGAGGARVVLDSGDRSEALTAPESGAFSFGEEPETAGESGSDPGAALWPGEEADGGDRTWELADVFARRLCAAAENL